MTNTFWQEVERQLDRIETEKPDTFRAVAAILDDSPQLTEYAGTRVAGKSSFFAGSGGDRSLISALKVAGWVTIWSEAHYHYTMRSPSKHYLTYIEGDVVPAGWSAEIGATR